jgi:hypothetical protein
MRRTGSPRCAARAATRPTRNSLYEPATARFLNSADADQMSVEGHTRELCSDTEKSKERLNRRKARGEFNANCKFACPTEARTKNLSLLRIRRRPALSAWLNLPNDDWVDHKVASGCSRQEQIDAPGIDSSLPAFPRPGQKLPERWP